MIKILLLSLILSTAQAADFGRVTLKQYIEWTDTNAGDTNQNITGFKVHIFDAAPATNKIVHQVQATRAYFEEIEGLTDGPKSLYVTAVNDAGLESEPSEHIELTFYNKQPLPPGNFKLFTISQSVMALPTIKTPPVP